MKEFLAVFAIATYLLSFPPLALASTEDDVASLVAFQLVRPTQAVIVEQSVRSDGERCQDAYVLRIDGLLPVRDSLDRDPGSSGCR